MTELNLDSVKKVKIAYLPTPLEELPRLSKTLGGPKIYVKRDDMTGLAFGGNKTRALEYLLVEALDARADVVVTYCGVQSNWARQTAAAARKFGLKAALVLRTAQFKEIPSVYDGNLLLDSILGADVRIIKRDLQGAPTDAMESVAEEYRKRGLKVHLMSGAASPLYSVSYFAAANEIVDQAHELGVDFHKVLCACSAGGTYAGLAIGFKALNRATKVLGVNVGSDVPYPYVDKILESANGAAKLVGCEERLSYNDVTVLDDFTCGGYGLVEPRLVEAVKLVAQTEGVILDPVYTGKVMLGILEMISRGQLKKDENVLFLHTGGLPGLFPYKEYFQEQKARQQ